MKHLGDLVLYCAAMGRQMAVADFTDAEAAQKKKKKDTLSTVVLTPFKMKCGTKRPTKVWASFALLTHSVWGASDSSAISSVPPYKKAASPRRIGALLAQ